MTFAPQQNAAIGLQGFHWEVWMTVPWAFQNIPCDKYAYHIPKTPNTGLSTPRLKYQVSKINTHNWAALQSFAATAATL